MTEQPPDPLPGLIAGIDQAVAIAPQLARYAWAVYDAFRSEGFSEGQALQLTLEQLRGIGSDAA